MAKAKRNVKDATQSKRKAVSAKFWSKRSSAFRTGHQKYPHLCGHWNSITDVYDLFGSEEARGHFVVLAEIAAAARPSPRGIELWKLWLAELICLKINCEERPHHWVYPLEYLSDPKHALRTPYDVLPAGESSQQPGSTNRVFEGRTITVHRLFEASALLCDRLESEARSDASLAGNPTDGPVVRNTDDVKLDTEAQVRAKRRSEWLDRGIAANNGWTSDLDIAANGGPTYNTIQVYRSGVVTSRLTYVRKKLALALKIKLQDVPLRHG